MDKKQNPYVHPPLQDGWWKTAAGWKSVLKSDRIDRRAKLAVIVFIGLMFVLFGVLSDWKGWTGYGFVALALIGVVLLYSPERPEEPGE